MNKDYCIKLNLEEQVKFVKEFIAQQQITENVLIQASEQVNQLQQENERLKKEKQELIDLLKRRIKDYSELKQEFEKGKLRTYKEILNKLEGKE